MTARINFGVDEEGKTVGDVTDAHLMSVAPTGAGKGTTSIIPNLLGWPGSVFVIDPKGENAERTAAQRRRMGQTVHVLDPFGIADSNFTEQESAQFNPLDFIGDGDGAITRADRLADTLIMTEKGTNWHWSAEARALLKALILHVCTAPNYEGHRNLAEINSLTSYPEQLVGTLDVPGEMQESKAHYGLIARIARRMAAKSDREVSSVWSTVQANLAQFLDDPRLRYSVSASSFDFADLREARTSIFAVLPAQYLTTFNRWLRLLVGSALDRLLEGMGEGRRPVIPILMVLDEFAHLGDLEAVRTAYGLARGAGVKMWIVLQSLSQLDDIFGEHGRENFVANSGAIEIFGMNDNHGSEYFSKKMGEEYIPIRSVTEGTTAKGLAQKFEGLSKSESVSQEKRFMMLPREIAELPADKKILFRRSQGFIILDKVVYFDHPELRMLATERSTTRIEVCAKH